MALVGSGTSRSRWAAAIAMRRSKSAGKTARRENAGKWRIPLLRFHPSPAASHKRLDVPAESLARGSILPWISNSPDRNRRGKPRAALKPQVTYARLINFFFILKANRQDHAIHLRARTGC